MTVFITLCAAGGEEPQFGPEGGDPFNMKMLSAAEFCYYGTDLLLRAFCDVLALGQTPQFKKGYFGAYRPTYERSTMSNSERFIEDQIILLQALPDFAFIARYKIPISGEDEFTKGVRGIISSKKVSLWPSFAAQVSLDIHHNLRLNIGKGFQKSRLTGLRAKKTVEGYFRFSQSLPNPIWPKQNDICLQSIQEIVDLFIVYGVFAVIKPVYEKDDEFSFLKWHPLHVGLLVFNINLRMQEIGADLC